MNWDLKQKKSYYVQSSLVKVQSHVHRVKHLATNMQVIVHHDISPINTMISSAVQTVLIDDTNNKRISPPSNC